MDNGLEQAWIGLRKQEDICNAGNSPTDFECRRDRWIWEDGADYTYPEWHDWDKSEPKWHELCLKLSIYRGWDGTHCHYEFPYLCERGKFKQLITENFFKQSTDACYHYKDFMF